MSDQIDISATGIEAAWQDFCEAGSATGNSGDIDLYDIDGMFETAQAMHELTVALRAALDAAEAERVRVVEALHFYADFYENPNDGPWGINSEDFGKVARTALKAKP